MLAPSTTRSASSCRLVVPPPGSSNTDALFDKELKKYDALKVDVARNVTRNEELLAAVSRDAQVRHRAYWLLAGGGWGWGQYIGGRGEAGGEMGGGLTGEAVGGPGGRDGRGLWGRRRLGSDSKQLGFHAGMCALPLNKHTHLHDLRYSPITLFPNQHARTRIAWCRCSRRCLRLVRGGLPVATRRVT